MQVNTDTARKLVNLKINGREPVSFLLNFHICGDRDANLPVEDAGEVGVRPVLANIERHSGDKLEELEAGSVCTFNIKFSQEICHDQKNRETCRHYPNYHFKTYKECDKSYVRSGDTSLSLGIFDIFL